MPIETAQLALVVSVIALAVAITTLWVNSLRPFRLRLSHDTPTFKLYEISPAVSGDESKRTWWIPSFDLGLSLFNSGRQPGEVQDIRIVATSADHRSERRHVFYPKWIVNYPAFQKDHHARFTWLDTAVERDWYPITLGGHSGKDVHVILEAGRWDHKEKFELKLVLEVISSSSRKWRKCAEYSLRVTEDMFGSKSSFSPYDEALEGRRQLRPNTSLERTRGR